MLNFDDLFTGQPAPQEETSFDKEAWAAKKQAEREDVYLMIDTYMLCKRNGVSVEGFSFDHMPEGYGQMDAKALRAEAGIIRDLAGEITADMNRLFAA